MKIILITVLILCAFSAIATAQTNNAPAKVETEVDLMWGVKIPMRDGVRLNATIYKPKPMPAPLPVILTLTPYISDSYHARANYFAKNGYVFATVDARGRGSSEGKFNPFTQEAKDGYDVVE
nr:CocE/NonD family hydrolase [Acidobacteriota bacterium]